MDRIGMKKRLWRCSHAPQPVCVLVNRQVVRSSPFGSLRNMCCLDGQHIILTNQFLRTTRIAGSTRPARSSSPESKGKSNRFAISRWAADQGATQCSPSSWPTMPTECMSSSQPVSSHCRGDIRTQWWSADSIDRAVFLRPIFLQIFAACARGNARGIIINTDA